MHKLRGTQILYNKPGLYENHIQLKQSSPSFPPPHTALPTMKEHWSFIVKGNSETHSKVGIGFDFVTASKSSFYLIALKSK